MSAHELVDRLKGPVLRRGDDGYDEARHLWNGRFDSKPDVIAQCVDADDVAAAVRWARSSDVAVAVKGGGHSYAGNSVLDGGLLIELSKMTGVKVRPDTKIVTVEAGATWAQLDAATQHHGLATTGVTASTVGVAGSTLGGGTGYLSRCFGNALDNLVSVDLVTSAGEQIRAAEDAEPDLFWAVRGGGGNFGIATSFEFRLHAVGPQVLAGQIIYPFDEAEEMLRRFGRFMADAPDELQCLPFTFRIPPLDVFPARFHGEPALDFVVFHINPESLDAVQPLRELGNPILDAVGPTDYTLAQQAFDANLPAGARYYSQAHDLTGLSDEAIDAFTSHVRRMQGTLSVAYLEPRGGQVSRIEATETAAGGRGAPYSFHILAGWEDPKDDATVMRWARDFHADMAAHSTGGVYINLLAEDEAARVPTAFSDHDRLRALKKQWDPHNVLRSNHNIAPA